MTGTELNADVRVMVERMAAANPEWAPIGMTREQLEAELSEPSCAIAQEDLPSSEVES